MLNLEVSAISAKELQINEEIRAKEVRIVVKFKGREMSHLEIGRDILAKFEEACSDVGTVDKRPALEGRFMSMVISPAKQPAK